MYVCLTSIFFALSFLHFLHYAQVQRKNQALTKFDLFCLAFFPVLFLVFVGVYVLAVMI